MIQFALDVRLLKITCPIYSFPSDINLCLRATIFSQCKWTKPHMAKLPINLNETFVFVKDVDMETYDTVCQSLNEESIVIELLQFSNVSKMALVIAQYKTYLYDFLFPLHLATKLVNKREADDISELTNKGTDEKLRKLKLYYPEKFQQSIYLDKGQYVKTYPRLEVEVSVDFRQSRIICTTLSPTAAISKTKSEALKGILKKKSSSTTHSKTSNVFKPDNTSFIKRPPFVVRKVPRDIFAVGQGSGPMIDRCEAKARHDRYALLDALTPSRPRKNGRPLRDSIKRTNPAPKLMAAIDDTPKFGDRKATLVTKLRRQPERRPSSEKYQHIKSRYKEVRVVRANKSTPSKSIDIDQPSTTKPITQSIVEDDPRDHPGSTLDPISLNPLPELRAEEQELDLMLRDYGERVDVRRVNNGEFSERSVNERSPHFDAFCVVCKLYRKYTRRPYWGHRHCSHVDRSSKWRRLSDRHSPQGHGLSISALLADDFNRDTATQKLSQNVSIVSGISTPTMQRIQLDRLMNEMEREIL